MGNSVLFPTMEEVGLAVRLNRWVARWQQGGLEPYALHANAASRARWAFPSRIGITEQRIWLDHLPEAFCGFRLVQLSDIHHGLFLSLEEVQQAVELTNKLEPDLVALTGDFVSYSRAYVEPVAALLGRLRARWGAFAVLGNHDFRVGEELVAHALRRAGIEVLRNRHTTLGRYAHALHVAGIDDWGYGADLSRALRGIPWGAPTILLAHNPRIIRHAARYAVSLVLSGHTHGGQINLPLVGTVYGRSPERMRYKAGWDRMGGTQIYVSRGIGTIVLPWRLRCPAEIPHFELHPRNNRSDGESGARRPCATPRVAARFAVPTD